MKALDTNRDGQLSESEIKNAPKALRTLDRNDDGKLTRDEIRPSSARRGGPGGPPRGESDRGRPDRERSERDRDGRSDRGGSRANRGGPAPANPKQFVKRLMSHDKNDDGRLSKDEVPERMRRFFDRVDTNSDGQIDKSEAKAMAKRFSERNAQRGGRGGDRPKRPDDE